MENHPIPQDVTGFQFKLVGNMTVKQFAFVAAGIITAVLIFYAPNPGDALLITLLKVIFVPLAGLSGVVVAFIPIEGRSVDVMLGNFVKAILSPNQYIYQKVGRHYAVTTMHFHTAKAANPQAVSAAMQATRMRQQQLQAYLAHVPHAQQNSLDEKEARFLQSVTTTAAPLSQAVQPVPPSTPLPQASTEPVQVAVPESEDQHGDHLASPDLTPEQQETELTHKAEQLQDEITKAHQAETTPGATPQASYVAHLHSIDLEKQLQDVSTQKQQLEQELLQLKNQLSVQNQKQVPTQPPQQPTTTDDQTQHVRKIPFNLGKNAGLPNTPDVPNLIVGIIKDPRGNVLNNILIEVKDKQGNPVRAFKSNALGQFASATQLPPGLYTISFEDPKGEHRFDVIEMNLKGEIIEPVEVISHDAREELRKALFN